MYATSPHLNLLVLRSPDIDRAVKFYTAMGLSFTKHAHGAGPEHYASKMAGLVFEIYPATSAAPSTASTRIGFMVDSIDDVVRLVAEAGAVIVKAPHDSEWGRRAVVKDLDGHTVELVGMIG